MTLEQLPISHSPFPTLRQWLHRGLGLILMGLVAGCGQGNRSLMSSALNSRYSEEEPALSGNGRFLAFVSNRDGQRHILLYDLQQQALIDLPRFSRRDAIASIILLK